MLKLRGCLIGNGGFHSLFEALQTNRNLEDLRVHNNIINFGDRDEAGNDFATTVFRLLTNKTTLQLLDMQDNDFDEASMKRCKLRGTTLPKFTLHHGSIGLDLARKTKLANDGRSQLRITRRAKQ